MTLLDEPESIPIERIATVLAIGVVDAGCSSLPSLSLSLSLSLPLEEALLIIDIEDGRGVHNRKKKKKHIRNSFH